MAFYKKRNRSDSNINPDKLPAALDETELVLKLKRDELFDQHMLLPHAELNSIVFNCVDSFVEKYKGAEMTLSIFTDPISSKIQDIFREVYRSHYEDELKKVNRFLKRHTYTSMILLIFSIAAFFVSSYLTRLITTETIISYIIGNSSVFCLWEVGYIHFAARDVKEEKKRITRALNAKIDFQ